MMELSDQIAELTANLKTLPPGSVNFAISLISQYHRKHTLSDGQLPYVAQLIREAKGERRTRVTEVGDFAGVVALFTAVSGKLRFPKIRLRVESQNLVLSVCGPKSSAPGSININGDGGWNGTWYGRVSPEGEFDRARACTDAFAAHLVPVLVELSKDPFAAVKRFGTLTGNCMFCGRSLEDQRSKVAGMGPVCAQMWGLGDQWKLATTMGPVPVQGLL
jgi:hypothetical protein